MIRDLVLYFLRQGEYNGEGDIAVLCAYLGQLQKVRQALKDLKIAVAVDERDEEQLMKQGIDDEVSFEQVIVAKHVSLLIISHVAFLSMPDFPDQAGYGRHFPRPGSQDRHRFACSQHR